MPLFKVYETCYNSECIIIAFDTKEVLNMEMKTEIKFGERLRNLRRSRGIQQAELGHRFKLSPSAIGSYERGLREPTYAHLVAFAEFFGVSIDYMMGRTEETMTVDNYISGSTIDFFEMLNKTQLSIHGNPIDDDDKKRISDIVVGLLWSKFTDK